MLLIIYTDIYTEYHVFKFDSAMCYAEKGYHLALRQNNQGYINRFQLHRAELLSISGLYSEAFDILNSINSPADLRKLKVEQLPEAESILLAILLENIPIVERQ